MLSVRVENRVCISEYEEPVPLFVDVFGDLSTMGSFGVVKQNLLCGQKISFIKNFQ